MKVFISYTHDGKEYAEKLERDLKAQDIGIWIDKRCIRPGHIWLREIDDALSQVDYVLGVITENYLTSVGGDEAYAIISKGLKDKKVRFISLFFTPPHEVKSVIIPALQGFNFSKNYTEGLRSFIEFLKQTKKGDTEELSAETEAVTLQRAVEVEEPILHNLPLQPTPFIGREEELTKIAKLLENTSCRLLTLVGPGGIGKTRLALQAASEKIGDFSQGVYFISLASLSSADFLVSTIADSLKFSFYSQEDPKVQLLNYLREKEILLLMDSSEHLLEGTGLLAEILENAPKVKILVTSRERLNLKGEWIIEVKGMKFPKSEKVEEKLESYSAVQLFLNGAQRVRQDFSFSEENKPPIMRICQLVEGMPLGIELAAAWVRMLSCREIAKEIEHNIDFLATTLRNVPERHQSLRAAFEHSWNLLSVQEKKVFRKISLFRDGFSRKAAEEVTGASLGLLCSLVDKSLLRRDPSGRYEMLEVLRQYAEEKLSEVSQEKEEVRNLHCGYYAEFLHQREGHLKGGKQKETLEEIGEEIENVRAAWRCAVEQGKEEEIGKSLESLYRFYDIRSWFQEGEEAFSRVVERLQGRVKSTICAKALAQQGVFSFRLGLYGKAEGLLQKSLSIFRHLGAQAEMAFSLNNLGNVAYQLRELRKAKQLYQESLAIKRKINDRKGIAAALGNLGNVAFALREYTEAKQRLQESLTICREISDRFGIATSLNNLGNVAYQLGEYTEAKILYAENLAIYKEIGHQWGIGNTLNSLGYVTCAQAEYQESEKLFYEALKTAMGIQLIPLELDVLVGMAALLVKEEKKENALELLALVLQHSASDKETKDDAERLLGELKAEFPVQIFKKIQKSGKTRRLEKVVKEILQGN